MTLRVGEGQSESSLVPQPTYCWKMVWRTKGVKHTFLSLTVIISEGQIQEKYLQEIDFSNLPRLEEEPPQIGGGTFL